ncbi:hypothetical protein BTV99_04940 [Psychrobacter sp. Rd 27.2]|nr:hypothetical protein BTV99_04940 [Psychrobacter sp. Rd 27.2]
MMQVGRVLSLADRLHLAHARQPYFSLINLLYLTDFVDTARNVRVFIGRLSSYFIEHILLTAFIDRE